MTRLPSGTVTFLFTDIEGSTRLWEEDPEGMRLALARHDALLRAAIEANGGHVFKTIGDAFCAAFTTASDALAAAVAAQRGIAQLKVRMALHTGGAEVRDDDYFGSALSRVARMLAACNGGQILLSGATHEVVADDLPVGVALRELGVHRLRDLQHPERIFQLIHPELPDEFPPLRTLNEIPNNLPQQTTSFVGRERDLAEVRRLLGTTRLLTITGSGGTGKTRLALQVAADLISDEPDGAWLVELAPIADSDLVPRAVAAALHLREEPGKSPVQTLLDYLRPKRLLLLLDNCEHLLTACAAIADALLRGSPGVRILATSREGLNIPGETTYRLPSLGVPPVVEGGRSGTRGAGGVEGSDRLSSGALYSQLATLNQLAPLHEYESVKLFIDRAAAVVPTFGLTEQNAAAVAQLCHRLDGIPLAIELAATRVKAMPVTQIADRLDDRFRLLTGGSRTALPRQQTLRALIDWSYDLLTEPEQALLKRLSVFAAGWTLEAAEEVCGCVGVWEYGCDPDQSTPTHRTHATRGYPTHTPIREADVLDLLTSLVDKSLVLYEEEGDAPRYRLLETVRQYARDRLLESGEAGSVRDCHLAYFLSLAEQAEPQLEGPDQKAWLARLEAENENLRVALSWGLEQAPPASALPADNSPWRAASAVRLAGALWWSWRRRAYLNEGREWLEQALRVADALPEGEGDATADLGSGPPAHSESRAALSPPGSPPTARAALTKVLLGAGALAWFESDLPAARERLERAVELARAAGDRSLLARALSWLTLVVGVQNDRARALACSEESVAQARAAGDTWQVAMSLLDLGLLAALEQDFERADAHYEESLALFRQRGETWGAGIALSYLGMSAGRRRDDARARAYYEQSLSIASDFGDQLSVARLLMSLGFVAQRQHDPAGAGHLFRQSLALTRHLGTRFTEIISLLGLALAASDQAQHARAVRLYAAEQALADTHQYTLPPGAYEERAGCLAAAREALGEEQYQAAWASGLALNYEEAIALALSEEPATEAVPAAAQMKRP